MPSEKTRLYAKCFLCLKSTRFVLLNDPALRCPMCEPERFVEQANAVLSTDDKIAAVENAVKETGIERLEKGLAEYFGLTEPLPPCRHAPPTECETFRNEHAFPKKPPTVENFVDELFKSCPNADPKQVEAVKEYLNAPVEWSTGLPSPVPPAELYPTEDIRNLADLVLSPPPPFYQTHSTTGNEYKGAVSKVTINGETVELNGFTRLDFKFNNPLTPERIIDIAANHGAEITTAPVPNGSNWKCAAKFVGLANYCDRAAEVSYVCKYDGGKNPVFPPFTLEAGLCYLHADRLKVGSTRDVSIGYKSNRVSEAEQVEFLKKGGYFKDCSDEQIARLVRAEGKDVENVAREIAEENAPRRAVIQRIVDLICEHQSNKETRANAIYEALRNAPDDVVERLSVCKKRQK